MVDIDPAEALTDALVANSDLLNDLDPADFLAMGPLANVAMRLIALLHHAEGLAQALLEGCQEADQDLPISPEVAVRASLASVERKVLQAALVTRPPAQVIQFPRGHRLPTMTGGDYL